MNNKLSRRCRVIRRLTSHKLTYAGKFMSKEAWVRYKRRVCEFILLDKTLEIA